LVRRIWQATREKFDEIIDDTEMNPGPYWDALDPHAALTRRAL
jgi:hypothetical protein